MAKGDDQNKPPTAPSASSQTPQQNQTLQGNPATQDNAQTSWMSPGNTPYEQGGITGGTQAQDTRSQPINNGTMLGQITAGSVGQYMPGGYDQGKFGDPNKHDPKYDIGRILSKYPPGPEGLQAARGELSAAGYNVVGKDKVQGPAGLIDVGMSFSDPNAQHSWQWNPVDQSGGGSQQGSMIGNQQGNNNNFLQQMFQQLMAQRQQYAGQQFNPSGGSTQPTTFNPTGQNTAIQPPMFANQMQPTMYGGGYTGLGNGGPKGYSRQMQ